VPGTCLPSALRCQRRRPREKLTDVITAGIPAAGRRLVRYPVDVMEFVGSEYTPRNLLLCGVRAGADPSTEVVRGHGELTAAWRVTTKRPMKSDVAEVLRS
jgi:hypothetical protein